MTADARQALRARAEHQLVTIETVVAQCLEDQGEYPSDHEVCGLCVERQADAAVIRDLLAALDAQEQETQREREPMTRTDWSERICAISIHPDSATRDEIAQLAADLMDARALLVEGLRLFSFVVGRAEVFDYRRRVEEAVKRTAA